MQQRDMIRQRVSVATSAFYQIMRQNAGKSLKDYLTFPRNMEIIAMSALDIPVFLQSPLTLQSAREYLCILSGVEEMPALGMVDRPLYGLLHVGSPTNSIFVEESLSPAFRNYVIAHEIGHYLYDIFTACQLWLSTMQEQKEAILQAFTWQKMDPWLEFIALLKGLPDRPQTITGRGQALRQGTRLREILADAIALELLAPEQEVTRFFHQLSRSAMLECLQEHFGLPRHIAIFCYADFQRAFTEPSDFLDRIFAPLLYRRSAENPS